MNIIIQNEKGAGVSPPNPTKARTENSTEMALASVVKHEWRPSASGADNPHSRKTAPPSIGGHACNGLGNPVIIRMVLVAPSLVSKPILSEDGRNNSRFAIPSWEEEIMRRVRKFS